MDEQNGSDHPSGLDRIDLQILELLQQDGRMAFSQIAEQLSVSPGMVRMRYNRMVEMGIVRIVAITDPLHMGFKTMALIGLRVDGSRLLQVAEEIAALDEVIYLIVTSGSFDIIAEVICRDQEDLLKFLTERLHAIEGIRETESFIHLKIVKEVYF